jgi:hypothetical protein
MLYFKLVTFDSWSYYWLDLQKTNNKHLVRKVKISKKLNTLLYDLTKVNTNLMALSRNLCQRRDYFGIFLQLSAFLDKNAFNN